jgi:hypothetical protein
MTYATGLRLLAAINALLCLTVILAPVCGPLGFFFYLKARQKEKEKQRLLNAQTN